MGLYDASSPGLTIHLRYLHIDMDPMSSTYLERIDFNNDTLDEEGRYRLGAQRTPSEQNARRCFLWKPLQLDGWDVDHDDDIHSTILDLLSCADRHLSKTQDLMGMIGQLLASFTSPPYSATPHQPHGMTEAQVYTVPLWQENAEVYFQLACRVPYLDQVRNLLAVCNIPYINERGDAWEIRAAVLALRSVLVNQSHMPLDEAVMTGNDFKSKADEACKRGQIPLAIAFYVRAIKQILPWFPSQHYMAPWESRRNGIGRLLVGCNINLALALVRGGLGMHKTAFHVLEGITNLECVTNWEKAKILHIQGRCADAMLKGAHIDACEFESYPEIINVDPDAYFLAQETYLAQPRRELANTSWMTSYSPSDFSKHYVSTGLAFKEAGKPHWWDLEETMEADNVHNWWRRIQRLRSTPAPERMDRVGESTDLEVNNASWIARGMERWDYAL